MNHPLRAGDPARPQLTLLQTVLDALRATGRIPPERPQLDLPDHFHRDNLLDFYLEQSGDGWAANISFRHIPPGGPDTLGTPDAFPLPEQQAFLAGAALVCEIVTGSPELPFFLAGDKLIVVSHGRPGIGGSPICGPRL